MFIYVINYYSFLTIYKLKFALAAIEVAIVKNEGAQVTKKLVQFIGL